jgi:2'-5' RNA ligase
MRTFLALDFGSHYSEELNSLKQKITPQKAKVKWVDLDHIHLTLHFFGDISDAQCAIIKDLFADHSGTGSVGLRFSLQDIGFFPSSYRPRVVWVGLKGNTKELATFHTELTALLENSGFPVEKRTFIPHITIGRIKAFNNDAEFIQKVQKTSFSSHTEISIKEVIFFKSTLTPSGPHYDVIERFPFKTKYVGTYKT